MPMFERWCASKLLQSAISVEAGDRDPHSITDSKVIEVLKTTEAPENGHIRIRDFLHKNGDRINSPGEVHPHQ